MGRAVRRYVGLVILIAACRLGLAQPVLDESPAVEGEWGYRPAEAAPVEFDPPALTWRPQQDAISYAVQVARDREFRDVTYAREGLSWSNHCPNEALGAGTYYWRYRAAIRDKGETTWSAVRSFVVPVEAVKMPQPILSELIARMPKDHPRLFFRPEDMAALRDLAGTRLDAEWKVLKAEADKILGNPPDTSDPPKYPEGVTRADGEWKKIWWGNRQRSIAVADGAATLAFVYRISGEEKYANGARDLLMALTRWDLDGATNYQYNDEAAMPLLYFPSRAYTWAHDALSEAERAAVVRMMRERGQQCFDHLVKRNHLWRPYASHSNRAWHKLGELAIAFHGDIPEADQWLDFAVTVYYTAYPVWSDATGGWHEGTAYWTSYLSRFMYWALAVDTAFGMDAFERPFFNRTGYYGMYAMPPGSNTGGFADSGAQMTSAGIAPLMQLLAAGARNRHWKWHAEAAGGKPPGGYFGFLLAARAKDLSPIRPDELPASAVFPGVGLAFLNSDLIDGSRNVQVMFKSSPMGRQSHGYNANNAFLLNVTGERALICSGRRDLHGSAHHTRWMWDSKSDNAILVNGRGQLKHSPRAKGQIILFRADKWVDVVAGEAAESYDNLSRWTRRIVFVKPAFVIIHDVLEASEPATFQWTLHALKPFEISPQQAVTGDVRVKFAKPQGLVISQTDQFDPPPANWAEFTLNEWHLTADCAEKAAQREFLTLIEIQPGPTDTKRSFEFSAPDSGNSDRVNVVVGDRKFTLQFLPSHFSIRSNDYSFDSAASSSG
jgi:hypothetical protein